MTTQSLQLYDYGWRLFVFYNITVKDLDIVLPALWENGCSNEGIREVALAIMNPNSGFTHTQGRTSIMGIGWTDSPEQFQNTLTHEINHLQDDICIYYAENYKNFPDIDLPMPETVVSSMPGSEEALYKGEDAYAYGFSSPEEFQAYLTAYLSMLSVEGYSFTTDKGRTTFEGGHELVSLAYEDGSVQWIFIKD